MTQPRKPKNPNEPPKPKDRRKLRLRPTGQRYEGSIVQRQVQTQQRVAIWPHGFKPDDEPDYIGLLVGIRSPRDGTPALIIAVNDRTDDVPFADVGLILTLKQDIDEEDEDA